MADGQSSHTPPTGIESTLDEHRVFAPAPAPHTGTPAWLISSMDEYTKLHDESINDPDTFFGRVAKELHWFSPFSKVLDWKAPDAKWFVGGKTNICYNCVDRHVDAGHGDNLALVWEGEPTDEDNGKPKIVRLTYAQLQDRVARFASGLESLGVKKGDVVTIYMGMVPELAIAVLACARIGAPHSVIFGGFSSQAIVDRVLDADSRILITCDGAYRRGKIVPLKDSVDAACDTLEKNHDHRVDQVIMVRRVGLDPMPWNDQRDVYFEDLEEAGDPSTPCEHLDAEDMAFLLYTSGSTGKPKGIVHTTGGYMVHTYLTSKYVFNLVPDCDEPKRDNAQSGQMFWCTADIGWITGHSYIVYGIMTNRVPTLMYEGAPNCPDEGRFWDIIERHKVTQFYTAPTAIRAFMKWGDHHPKKHDLSSVQVLGTVGEPINPEAWMWYRRVIGNDTCPIVDTWWQTETGGHMLTPLPGVTPTTPGSCTLPIFGVDAAILNENGNELPRNSGGLLAIRKPWPGMLRGIYNNRERFIETYWSKFYPDGKKAVSPYYFPGDGARQDTDGNFWIMGRVDDVINVSGHRLGTMEVESALVSHSAVVEAAVVGMPHEIKGTGIAAFCTLDPACAPVDAAAATALKADLAKHVAQEIGAIAKPDQIRFTDALPKTRSGKIMRRLLRSIAEGKAEITQDTTTLEDFSVLAKLQESDES